MYRYCLYFFFCCLAFLLQTVASAQVHNLQTKSYSIPDGLPGIDIQCVLQDTNGFAWVGTSNGLARFDGYHFISYFSNEEHLNTLPSSNIRSLYLNKNGDLLIGTTKGLSKYNETKDNFETLLAEDENSLGQFDINAILEDSEGYLWLSAYRRGLLKFNPETNDLLRYSHDPEDDNSISSNNIFSVFQDSEQHLIITTYDGGITVYIPDSNSFISIKHNPQDPASLLGNNIHSVAEDSQGRLWFACNQKGLSVIPAKNLFKGRFENYIYEPAQNSPASNTSRIVCADRENGVWIGMQNGKIDYFDNTKFVHFRLSNKQTFFRDEDDVNTMYADSKGNIWVGTRFSGLHILHQTPGGFETYRAQAENKHWLSHNKIWEFTADDSGNIWIATDGGGLNEFNPASNTFNRYNKENQKLPSNDILTVCRGAKDELWLGSWNEGLIRFNYRTGVWKQFTTNNSRLLSNHIFDIDTDSQGRLWIATQNGLHQYDPRYESFTVFTTSNSDLIFNQMEVVKVLDDENILIGNVQGFLIFNPRDASFNTYQHQLAERHSLSDNFITTIHIQDSNTIWLGTLNGLSRFNKSEEKFTTYLMEDGLPSNIIYGIESDLQERLWISTNLGISLFNPANKISINYGPDDGIQDYIFIKKSHLKSNNGYLYFGGINGFTRIDPVAFVDTSALSQIQFTRLLVSNKPVNPNDETGILSKQLHLLDTINISHNYPTFSVQFSTLKFLNTENVYYSYKLEGYDTEWTSPGRQRSATYTNLDPGRYILKVRSHSNNSSTGENIASLCIRILPPWWNTLAFKIVLIILIIALILVIYFSRVKNLRRQKAELEDQVDMRTRDLKIVNKELTKRQSELSKANSLLEEKQEEIMAQNEELEKHRNNLEKLVAERTGELEAAKEKAEESDRLKSAFLANLSHEIRTPMNAIVGFASMLDTPDLSDRDKNHYIDMVTSNCDSLTILINDIIDISLIESNQLKINKSPFHVDAIFEELLSYYESINQKALNYDYINKNRTEELVLDNDPIRFKQVVSNLLSNATKYTHQGQIEFGYKLSGSEVEFFVKDSGIGIKEEEFERVFNQFQKLDTSDEKLYRGVGIGLSICKRLVELMQGKIWVESKLNKGSTFYFTIPYNKKDNISITHKRTKAHEKKIELDKYTVLIAEDDTTNYMLLNRLLKPTHAKVLWAKDGQEAVEMVNKMKDTSTLIILMDIKMPRMNGMEALRAIRRKHPNIPIIAVTAYAQEQNKSAIIMNNFNSYVTKPIMRPILFSALRDALQ